MGFTHTGIKMPRHGFRFHKCWALILIIEAAVAFDFVDILPKIFPGDEVEVKWSFSPRDPTLFDLELSCQATESLIPVVSGVGTSASPLVWKVPAVLPGGLHPPVLCSYLAMDPAAPKDAALLVASDDFQILPKDPSSASSSPSSTTSHKSSTSSKTLARDATTFVRSSLTVVVGTSLDIITTQTYKGSPTPATSTPTPTNPPVVRSMASTSTSTDTSPVFPTTTETIIPMQKQKRSTETIAGAILASLAFLILLGLAFLAYRRQRQARPTLIPLIHDHSYTQPLEKSGECSLSRPTVKYRPLIMYTASWPSIDRLARILEEKAATQRQHAGIQAELQRNISGENQVARPLMVKTGPDETVAAMEQQGETLRRRILELETQQCELEDQLYGPQAPPDYASEPSARST